MKQLKIVFVGFLVCGALLAQDVKGRIVDKKFWAVGAGLMASTAYDIETTHRSLSNCADCREGNPIAGALISRNRPTAYAVGVAVNSVVMYVAYRLKKSGHKPWWIYPTIVTGVHTASGSSNLRFVR